MTDVIPVISDLQVPFHDERAVAAVATFIAHYGYSSVSVGDVLDQYQVSKWCKGKHGEFDGRLGEQRDQAVTLLSDLRVRDISRSNHDDRLEYYLRDRAPALVGLPELRIDEFLRLSSIGATYHRQPYDVASQWLLLHGDEGTLSSVSGQTALKLALRTGRSVVCGHTHRVGLAHSHSSFRGRLVAPLWGLEVGHLMDMSKAEYLKGGIANWQPAFGVLVVDGDDVTPIPVPITDGAFWFDGRRWRG